MNTALFVTSGMSSKMGRCSRYDFIQWNYLQTQTCACIYWWFCFCVLLQMAVCSRELCVFSYHTLGVMSGATEEVATGAEVSNTFKFYCSDYGFRFHSNLCCSRWLTCLLPCVELHFSHPAKASYLNHTPLLLIHATQKCLPSVLRYHPKSYCSLFVANCFILYQITGSFCNREKAMKGCRKLWMVCC